jgi:4-diphosphocytidyl-2-C-methyl-D-erythritol kinase
LEPIIKKVLSEICKNKNCLVSRMSGSGPTCFGLFENYSKAHSAKLRLMKDFPNWWVVSSKLTVDKSELSPFNLL